MTFFISTKRKRVQYLFSPPLPGLLYTDSKKITLTSTRVILSLKQLFTHYSLSIELESTDSFHDFQQSCQNEKVQSLPRSVQSFYQSSGPLIRPTALKVNQENTYLSYLNEQKWFKESKSQEEILQSLNHLMKEPKNLSLNTLKNYSIVKLSKPKKMGHADPLLLQSYLHPDLQE